METKVPEHSLPSLWSPCAGPVAGCGTGDWHRPTERDAEFGPPKPPTRVTNMQFTHLGRTGLKVSRLCLGTMNFGPQTDEADAHTIMDSAHEHGINFFDTANVYGGADHRGRTEEIIGRWFARAAGAASRRCWPPSSTATWTTAQRGQAVGAQHPAGARRQPEAAADRLHRPLPVPPHRPGHPVGRDLAGHRGRRPAGQDPLHRQQQLRRLAHRPGPGGRRPTPATPAWSASSPSTTCSSASIELEVIPAAQHYGLGIIPWSPLQGGLLGGVLQEGSEGVRRHEGRAAETLETTGTRSRRTRTWPPISAHEPGDVALAWLLHQPAVTAPIIGPRTQEQLDAALRAVDVDAGRGDARPAGRDLPGPQDRPGGLRLVTSVA